ncbi:hypothetical protein JTB14_012893 [Gonioctena quinquepunctata]|nr:hypothetical protein JTB14_012893 [Gonioctena quinquepunctata]
MADLGEKEPPDKGERDIDINQSGIAYTSTTLHPEEATSQEDKCESHKPAADFQMGKMNLDKLDIPITLEKGQENSPDSLATPLYVDARTSTTENPPQTEEKITKNSENMESNHKIKHNIKQILTGVLADVEGSVHSFISNVVSDEVIILKEGNNPQLPSSSEVEQTVDKAVTVGEYIVAEGGTLIAGKSTEYSPNFADGNNTTVIEIAKQQLTPKELVIIVDPIENKFKTPNTVSEPTSNPPE